MTIQKLYPATLFIIVAATIGVAPPFAKADGSFQLSSCDGHLAPELKSAIEKSWMARKPAYLNLFRLTGYPTGSGISDGGTRYNSEALYDITNQLWPLLNYSRHCHDPKLLSEITEVLNAMPMPTTSDGKWLDKDGKEHVLGINQWMYLLASVLNRVASVPAAQQTDAHKLFFSRYIKNVAVQNVGRWIFGNPTPFSDWPQCGADFRNVNHRDRLVALLPGGKFDQRGSSPYPSYCRSITDPDLLIVGAAAELLGAYDLLAGQPSPTDPNASIHVMDPQVDGLKTYLSQARQLFKARTTRISGVKDDSGNPVQVLGFDEGVFRDHPDYLYSLYTGDSLRKAMANPPANCSNSSVPVTPITLNPTAARDIGHAIRYVWVFWSLYLNHRQADEYPNASYIDGYAANLAYRVRRPGTTIFKNSTDGSPGWIVNSQSAWDACGNPTIHTTAPDVWSYQILYGYSTWVNDTVNQNIKKAMIDCNLLPASMNGTHTAEAYCAKAYSLKMVDANVLMIYPNLVNFQFTESASQKPDPARTVAASKRK